MRVGYFIHHVVLNVCLGFVLLGTGLFAGTTGKISGVITDSKTGEPLAGVNISVEGTTLGTASNPNGHYDILNLSPGSYTLRIRMMGYREQLVEGLQVRIDLTTTYDTGLDQTVLESGEAVTVVAERPLVQHDMTSSLASVNSEEIEALPVQSVSDVLELQAGVVRDGSDFHIRGGRANEITFWVDGLEVTDVYSGQSMGATVEKDAIQELQVVSGTFNAEYGKAMAGVVNIITKEGQQSYKGKISAYAGDYVSTGDVYRVLTRVDTMKDPGTGKIMEVDQSENPLSKFNPTYNADFSLGGPVPLLGDKMSFFTNGRYNSREEYIYGREWFTAQGLAGDSSLVPMRAGYDYSGLAKLTWRVLPSLKLNYQVMYHKSHDDRSYSRSYRYVPGGIRQSNSYDITHMLYWTHSLSPNTFYEVRLSHMYRENDSYLYKDPEKTPHWLVKVPEDATAGIDEMVIDPSTTSGAALLDSIKLEDVSYSWFIDPNDPEGYLDPDSAKAPTGNSYYRVGTQNDQSFRSYGFSTAKFDITSQINPTHQVKAGVELKLHQLERDDYTPIAKKVPGKSEQIIPYTPEIPSESSLSRDKYLREPREFSAYIQDKIELKEMIVNIGIRFDYFDANSTIPTDYDDPDIYNPFKYKNIYKDWVDPETALSQVELEQYISNFETYTPEERKAFMRKKVSAKVKLSPRIGIAYPITDRGNIHFSYGHFFGMPGLQYLYNNAQFKLQSGGGNSLIGNPDLAAERTVHYELGLQQQLRENVGMDITLFYKDTRGWVGASPLIRTARPSVSYSQYENKDYERVLGLTVELEQRLTRHFSSRVYYAYQFAEGSYSNPSDAYNAIQNEEEPRIALIPTDWDQRHTLNAYIVYSRNNWTMTLTGKYDSGQPYTPSFAVGETVGSSSFVGWSENSARLPSTSSLDLRILKKIPLKTMNIDLFMVVYNLLDQRGERSVYSETGTASYSADLNATYSGYNAKRIGSYNDWVRRPEWYQAPREVQVGMSVNF